MEFLQNVAFGLAGATAIVLWFAALFGSAVAAALFILFAAICGLFFLATHGRYPRAIRFARTSLIISLISIGISCATYGLTLVAAG